MLEITALRYIENASMHQMIRHPSRDKVLQWSRSMTLGVKPLAEELSKSSCSIDSKTTKSLFRIDSHCPLSFAPIGESLLRI
jgi:hypothetical protein